jgi:transcriptional repressor NrdR
MVMQRLAKLNEVAYVRFASVYRRFTDIAGFEQQLSEIKARKTDADAGDIAGDSTGLADEAKKPAGAIKA